MIYLTVWAIGGFALVMLWPASDRPTRIFQIIVGGPLIWLTMLALFIYWKRYGDFPDGLS